MKTIYINKLANNHVNEYNDNTEHISDLISYGTRVASYDHKTNKISVYGWFSSTTAKHINSFLEFYGFDKINKQKMMNYEAI